MRKFIGEYDVVQVWSIQSDEHQAALEIYRRRGYENTTPTPRIQAGEAVPYRSEVRRRLRYTGDDRT